MSDNKEAITPIQEFGRSIRKMESQFRVSLPTTISPEKFFNVSQTAVAQNPSLLEADRQSLYLAFLSCAQDGLLPDGREATVQIFNTNIGTKDGAKWVKKAQYLPMVYGILKKLHSTGEIASTSCDVVYEGDEFDRWTDESGDHLKHRQKIGGSNRKALAVYFIVRTKGGGIFMEVMTAEEVESIRSMSKSANSPAWKNSWSEMAKKVVIKRVAKRAPLPDQALSAVRADDDVFMPVETAAMVSVSSESSQQDTAKKSRVKKMIEAKKLEDVEQAKIADLPKDMLDEERAAIQSESIPI